MLLLLVGFIIAALISSLMIPRIISFSLKHNIVDLPESRKVHNLPIPRLGGCGIFLSFALVVWMFICFKPNVFHDFTLHSQNIYLLSGALLAFSLGLVDDFKSIRARYKLCIQIVVASLAYAGGIRIETIGIQDVAILELELLTPVASIIWMILIINAINLIDGLDGLAGGVSLVSAFFLCYISYIGGRSDIALAMAILGGSVLGFLRYNFNPAAVFMGDGGSYFLGYMLGSASVLSLIDTQSTFTILIPMLALALPIIDVTMATVRRFIHGQPIFDPDKKHFHHMLLNRGLSHRRAVLVLYTAAVIVSISALLLTHLNGQQALTVLAILAILVAISIHKLGYFTNYNISIIPWFNSFIDSVGLSRQRRSFFDLQVQINNSKSLPELWRSTEKAVQRLDFLHCTIYLRNDSLRLVSQEDKIKDRRKTPAFQSSVALRRTPPDWNWTNPEIKSDENNRSLFRLEVDLKDNNGIKLGTLLMIKDQRLNPVGHFTLKRIESLRRSIAETLAKIQVKEKSRIINTNVKDESDTAQISDNSAITNVISITDKKIVNDRRL